MKRTLPNPYKIKWYFCLPGGKSHGSNKYLLWMPHVAQIPGHHDHMDIRCSTLCRNRKWSEMVKTARTTGGYTICCSSDVTGTLCAWCVCGQLWWQHSWSQLSSTVHTIWYHHHPGLRSQRGYSAVWLVWHGSVPKTWTSLPNTSGCVIPVRQHLSLWGIKVLLVWRPLVSLWRPLVSYVTVSYFHWKSLLAQNWWHLTVPTRSPMCPW